MNKSFSPLQLLLFEVSEHNRGKRKGEGGSGWHEGSLMGAGGELSIGSRIARPRLAPYFGYDYGSHAYIN